MHSTDLFLAKTTDFSPLSEELSLIVMFSVLIVVSVVANCIPCQSILLSIHPLTTRAEGLK